MARYSGHNGEVTVGGVSVTGVKAWTIDQEYQVHDVKGFDDAGVPNKVPGGYDWKGTFSGPKNGAPLTIGTQIALVLKETQTATQKFSGNAIISSLGAETNTDGAVTYNYTFEGTGALTIPTA